MTRGVSVIIPAYNAAATIEATIASALTQTLPPLEVIVVDDGSSDDTAERAKRAGARVITQPNAGVSAARNRALEAAQGEWIAFLDADDCWLPEKLALQHQALDAAPAAEFVFCDMQRIAGTEIRAARWMLDRAAYQRAPKERCKSDVVTFSAGALSQALMQENFVPTSSVLVKRSAIPFTGFAPELRYCEDVELWLRIVRDQSSAAVEASLMTYRLHETSASAQWANILRGDLLLTERIAQNPASYHASLQTDLRTRRQAQNLALGIHLTRSRQPREALPYLKRALKPQPGLKPLLWLVIATILRAITRA